MFNSKKEEVKVDTNNTNVYVSKGKVSFKERLKDNWFGYVSLVNKDRNTSYYQESRERYDEERRELPEVAVRAQANLYYIDDPEILLQIIKKFYIESEFDEDATMELIDGILYFNGSRPMTPDEVRSFNEGLFE